MRKQCGGPHFFTYCGGTHFKNVSHVFHSFPHIAAEHIFHIFSNIAAERIFSHYCHIIFTCFHILRQNTFFQIIFMFVPHIAAEPICSTYFFTFFQILIILADSQPSIDLNIASVVLVLLVVLVVQVVLVLLVQVVLVVLVVLVVIVYY
jgi:hypothetical protein